MIKVLIDGHMLGTGEGGNERYIEELSKSLMSIPGLELFIYASPKYIAKQKKDVKKHFVSGKAGDLKRLILDIEKKAGELNVDIIHSTYVAPFITKRKLVLTVHDLAFKRYPELFNVRQKIVLNKLMPISLKKASAVIVPSYFSKRELIHFYPFAKRVNVTYEAGAGIFKKVDKKRAIEFVRNKYKINKPYFLTMGGGLLKRRLKDTFKAFNSINDQADLLVVGKYRGVKERAVKYLGFVDDETLNFFYAGAVGLIYYTLYEGFGLPVVEAINSGTQVVGSDIPVLKEVFGNSIFYAGSTKELQRKMGALLKGERKVKDLKNFSWSKTARETYKVYRKVMAE